MKQLRAGRMKAAERTAALTAIRTAASKHAHVAIRPARKWDPRRSPGVEVDPKQPDISRQLNRAIDRGFAATPDDNWEVIGSDEFANVPDDCDVPDAFAWWGDPVLYGEFSLDSFDSDEAIDNELGAGPGT